MSITLPTDSEANTQTLANRAAAVTAAEAAFVANATVLINQAIANGFLRVQPFLNPLVTSAYVMTYFQAQGYTVTFPLSGCGCGCDCSGVYPSYPYEPCFVSGFPEALPPGYIPWNCECGYYGPSRIQISWFT